MIITLSLESFSTTKVSFFSILHGYCMLATAQICVLFPPWPKSGNSVCLEYLPLIEAEEKDTQALKTASWKSPSLLFHLILLAKESHILWVQKIRDIFLSQQKALQRLAPRVSKDWYGLTRRARWLVFWFWNYHIHPVESANKHVP